VDVVVSAPVRRMCGFSSLFCCSFNFERPVFIFWRANPASTPTPQPHASSVRAHSSPHAVHLPQFVFYYGECQRGLAGTLSVALLRTIAPAGLPGGALAVAAAASAAATAGGNSGSTPRLQEMAEEITRLRAVVDELKALVMVRGLRAHARDAAHSQVDG
jgi:hypothetical protein